MNFNIIFMLTLSALLLCPIAAVGASAPAGSVLESNSEVYVGGEHRALDPVYVKVNQIYGLSIHPGDIKIQTRPGVAAYAPCRLENLGNGTDKVTIRYNKTSNDLRILLIVDENNDAIHQSWEVKQVPPVLSLGEGAAYYFFVEALPSAAAKKGSWTWTGITVASSGKEGNEYVGYNGMRYGGDQKVSAMISAIVE